MAWKRAALAPAMLQHGMQSIRKKQVRRIKASKDQGGSSRRKMTEAFQTSSIREAEPGRESGGKQNHQGRTSVKMRAISAEGQQHFFRHCWPMLAWATTFFSSLLAWATTFYWSLLAYVCMPMFAYRKRDVTLPSVPMPQVWEQRRKMLPWQALSKNNTHIYI